MNHRDFVEKIKQRYQETLQEPITTEKLKLIVDMVFQVITDNLKKGIDTRITDFGVFRSFFRKTRKGNSPIIGENYHIPGRQSVAFRSATKLKQEIANREVVDEE